MNSGKFLRPMLSKSQCWCVDDKSIFVLRAREDSFYRIELPFETDQQKENVEELKKVLDSLLRYEKTPCPFRDGYVTLPEDTLTPPRRLSGRASIGKAKKWKLNRIWEPEDGVWLVPSPRKSDSIIPDGSPSKLMSFEQKDSLFSRRGKELQAIAGATRHSRSLEDQTSPLSPKSVIPVPTLPSKRYFFPKDQEPKKSFRHQLPQPFKVLRSVTLPPHLTTYDSPPSNSAKVTSNVEGELETSSLSSDHESFYSLEETSEDEIFMPRKYQTLSVDGASTASPPETPRAAVTKFSSEPVTPTLANFSTINQQPTTAVEIGSPGDQNPRLHRPFLPIVIEDESSPSTPQPPTYQPLSILSPTFPSPSKSMNSNGIIERACALLMGTPIQLVITMLKIAARILRRIPGSDRVGLGSIPGAWDSDFEEEEEWDDAQEGIDELDIDDFGYPVGRRSISPEFKTMMEDGHDNHDGNDVLD
jgi:hypothetical protein